MKSGYLEVYHALSEDLKVDFAVMGGGISGALQAWHLYILFIISPPLMVILLFIIWKELKARKKMK